VAPENIVLTGQKDFFYRLVGWEELNDIEIETSLWYWKKHEKG
jgi:hypothetical protein